MRGFFDEDLRCKDGGRANGANALLIAYALGIPL